jgi:hypothetical protein
MVGERCNHGWSEEHEGPEYVSLNDNNDYTLGKVGKRNVVIAVLPDKKYGGNRRGSGHAQLAVSYMLEKSSTTSIHVGNIILDYSHEGGCCHWSMAPPYTTPEPATQPVKFCIFCLSPPFRRFMQG